MSRKGSAAASAGGDAPTFDVKGYDFGSVELAPMRSNATKPFVVLVLASNEGRGAIRAQLVAKQYADSNAHLLIDTKSRDDIMHVSSLDDSAFGFALRNGTRLIIVTSVTPANKVPIFIRKNIDLLIVDQMYSYKKPDNDAMTPPLRSAELRDELPVHFKKLEDDMAITYPRDGGNGELYFWRVDAEIGVSSEALPRSSLVLSAPLAKPKVARAPKDEAKEHKEPKAPKIMSESKDKSKDKGKSKSKIVAIVNDTDDDDDEEEGDEILKADDKEDAADGAAVADADDDDDMVLVPTPVKKTASISAPAPAPAPALTSASKAAPKAASKLEASKKASALPAPSVALAGSKRRHEEEVNAHAKADTKPASASAPPAPVKMARTTPSVSVSALAAAPAVAAPTASSEPDEADADEEDEDEDEDADEEDEDEDEDADEEEEDEEEEDDEDEDAE